MIVAYEKALPGEKKTKLLSYWSDILWIPRAPMERENPHLA